MLSVETVKELEKKNFFKEPHDCSETKTPAAGVSQQGPQGGVLGNSAAALSRVSHGVIFCSSYGPVSLLHVFE